VKRLVNQYETTLDAAIIAEDVLESQNLDQWIERSHGGSKFVNTMSIKNYSVK